jgi:hypothetical protein
MMNNSDRHMNDTQNNKLSSTRENANVKLVKLAARVGDGGSDTDAAVTRLWSTGRVSRVTPSMSVKDAPTTLVARVAFVA